jgi:hypothetical protein
MWGENCFVPHSRLAYFFAVLEEIVILAVELLF